MTRRDLAKKIAKEFNLTIAESDRIIRYFLSQIQIVLYKGGRIDLRGFGTFHTKRLTARIYRDSKTGKVIKIPTYKRALFRQSKNIFKKRIKYT